MATIKSYTDLSQSKKLAEILPVETADMNWNELPSIGLFVRAFPYKHDNGATEGIFPCWSLTALLGVIPKHIKDYNVLRIDIAEDDFAIWYDEIGYGVNNDLPNITMESAIDACCEMILKLHELKML